MLLKKLSLKEQNNYLIYFDQLSSLPNRQSILLDILEKNPTACIVFNIDDFREINNFFGTQNTDKPIKNLQEEAKNILNILTKEPFYLEDKEVTVNFSVGIAQSHENLLTKTDIAVHNAKSSDKNIYVYSQTHNIEEQCKKNIELATKIKDAILESRLICHYQPLLNIENREIYAYETLVRMIDKNGNIIPPVKFLKLSKKIRLYPSITKRVVQMACRTFQNRNENFSINLSIDDIKDSNYTKNYQNYKYILKNYF